SDALEQMGIPTRVMSAIEMHQVAEPYIRRRAIRHLEKGRIVIFAAGTSNPYFSTDTAATLRALEIKAQVIAKATRVNGVYDKDPLKFPDAIMYPEISFLEVLSKGLGVMDASAVAMCRDNHLPILVFNLTTTVNQLANLHVPEPTLITLQPWDVSQMGAIEKAIRASDLGLNPANDGKIIRIPLPALTEERRKELVKHLHTVAEDHRVAIRNVRRDGNE